MSHTTCHLTAGPEPSGATCNAESRHEVEHRTMHLQRAAYGDGCPFDRLLDPAALAGVIFRWESR